MARNSKTIAPADQPRIAMPALDPALNLTPSSWKVLSDSIFPSAKTAEGIVLAVHYCAARNLDVMKRPVHVVPMYSKTLGREIETVWPGIAELQTTAARTGQWAGMDAPRFGPLRERSFSGRVKRDGSWQELEVAVSFPEWCEVTVYRIVNGQRCPFTEPVFWLEAYARLGGSYSELPTDMWVKRPRGQLMKCAKAASLRAAFPEEATYTAEEMEGKVIETDTTIPVQSGAGVASTLVTGTNGSAETTENTASHPDSEPKPEALPEPVTSDVSAPASDPPGVDPELKQRIDQVIARAVDNRAWRQAEQYLRARCSGADLAYALEALKRGQRAAGQPQAA